MKYPIYRKYSNNKSYFKILDANRFEEIQVIGSNFMVHQFEAKILPDRNFIHDMTELSGGGWEQISADDYTEFHEKCIQEYNMMN